MENERCARGQTQPIRLPEDLQELALRATKSMGLLYAGVDILETENGPVLLEVNGSPSWQGLQKATGVNVAERLVQFVVNLARR
ncbi:MAG: RimK family alpha-L-glutamate ligase [Candidatus Bathyarchaeia archaeon]